MKADTTASPRRHARSSGAGKLYRCGILAAAIALLGIVIALLPAGYDLEENLGLGLLFDIRGERAAPEDVVIIALDAESSEQLHLPKEIKEWPRNTFSQLIRQAREAGASVIAFDLLFGEAKSAEDDARLAEAMQEAGNVILLSQLVKETVLLNDPPNAVGNKMIVEIMTPPNNMLLGGAIYSAPFPLPKIPTRVSQYWAFKQTGDVPTLPAAVLQVHAMQAFDDLARLLQRALTDIRVTQAGDMVNIAARAEATWIAGLDRAQLHGVDFLNRLARGLKAILGKDTLIAAFLIRELDESSSLVPDPRHRRLLKSLVGMYRGEPSRYLNFYGPPRTITTIPYYQLVRDSTGHDDNVHSLRNKAVFIGVSDAASNLVGDTYTTVYSQEDGLDLSGVEIAATAFTNLLEQNAITPLGFGYYLLIIGLCGLVAGMISLYFEPIVSTVALVTLGVGYITIAHAQFASSNVWIPVVIPLLIQAPAALVLAILWKYFEARKIEEAHEQLKEMDRLKSMFLSHVSHELKTPLTSIRGFVDNMTSGLTGDLGEKQRDYLMRIRANTDRLTRMIANLLNVSRIESGVQHLERMPVYLCDAVHECVMQLQLMAESRNIRLETHCPDTDLRVLADPDKLIEIITNLVDNAIKFTPQGGIITIDTRQQEPDKIVVSVTDTGEGIEPEDLDDLFKPFYQAKRTKAHTQGLGLGLSIVKHLVEMHDGSITVTSEPGKGSQFRIELPELAQQGEAT